MDFIIQVSADYYRFFCSFIIEIILFMNTSDLKIDLITQIASLTDKVRIKELLQILKFESDNSVYTTTLEEKDVVSEARNEISNGEFISNDEFQKEINKWLNK